MLCHGHQENSKLWVQDVHTSLPTEILINPVRVGEMKSWLAAGGFAPKNEMSAAVDSDVWNSETEQERDSCEWD